MDTVCLLTDAEMTTRLVAHGRAARPRPPYPLLFPASLVERAARHLRENGRRGDEQLVLWGGYPTSCGVVITSLLMPETQAEPLWVRVLSAEQPKIAGWLRERGQLLFAEAHTHGDGVMATQMSCEDRRHPAGRQDGFLTIIVPGYARTGIDFVRAGIWECRALAWVQLPPADVRSRLRLLTDQEARRALD